jgi:hypothetical protein
VGDKGSQCIGLTTLPPSHNDFLEIWEPQLPGTLRPVQGLLRFIIWTPYTYLSKDVRICGYFLKPKGVREQKRLGSTAIKHKIS